MTVKPCICIDINYVKGGTKSKERWTRLLVGSKSSIDFLSKKKKIDLAKRSIAHGRSKHIETRFHFF